MEYFIVCLSILSFVVASIWIACRYFRIGMGGKKAKTQSMVSLETFEVRRQQALDNFRDSSDLIQKLGFGITIMGYDSDNREIYEQVREIIQSIISHRSDFIGSYDIPGNCHRGYIAITASRLYDELTKKHLGVRLLGKRGKDPENIS